MANTSRPRGLRPIGNLNGGPWSGKANPYYLNKDGGAANAAAVGIGSIVSLTGAASEDGNGLPVVQKWVGELDGSGAQTATASQPVGVVVGFQIDPTVKGDLPNHRLISTSRLVYVCDDPQTLFEVQEDSNGGQLAAASVGLHAALTSDTPSATTGYSNQELDTSTAGTSASLPVKIIAFARRVDNEVSSSYAKVIVKFVKHAYLPTPTTAAIGV